jgi:excisionase family DNA binding protein
MATAKRDLTDPRVQGPRPAGRTVSQRKARAHSLPQLLTVQEVAEILRVPPKYVTRRLVFERRIRFIKVGRRTLFDPVDIENFLAERTITPAE